jgi:hypothetical protein
MLPLKSRWTPDRILIAALSLFLLSSGQVLGQETKDPHRPACTSSKCRKVKAFVKSHYCGTPEGNGPDDSCTILPPKKRSNVKVIADYECKWNDGKEDCQQHGQASPDLRNRLVDELRRIGLPANAQGRIYFTVWQAISLGTIAEASYNHLVDSDVEELCEVILIVDATSRPVILRKVPFQKVDADKNNVTTWSPIDLADVNGDGQLDVILEGDAYEDHWIEVDSLKDSHWHTTFSGLGYFL